MRTARIEILFVMVKRMGIILFGTGLHSWKCGYIKNRSPENTGSHATLKPLVPVFTCSVIRKPITEHNNSP